HLKVVGMLTTADEPPSPCSTLFRSREGGICDSLCEAVQAIVGPIENQRRVRDLAAERWTELFTSLEPAMAELPEYRDWLEGRERTEEHTAELQSREKLRCRRQAE